MFTNTAFHFAHAHPNVARKQKILLKDGGKHCRPLGNKPHSLYKPHLLPSVHTQFSSRVLSLIYTIEQEQHGFLTQEDKILGFLLWRSLEESLVVWELLERDQSHCLRLPVGVFDNFLRERWCYLLTKVSPSVPILSASNLPAVHPLFTPLNFLPYAVMSFYSTIKNK